MVTPLRVAAQRSGDGGQRAPLIGIKARQRNNICRRAAQVVILRRDLLKKRSTEHADQRLEFAVAKAVQFLRAKDGVILAVGPRRQLNLVTRKNLQSAQSRIASKQFVQG